MSKLTKNTLTCGEVCLADGSKSPLVRLDKFRGVKGADSAADGSSRPMSSGYANQMHVDAYLLEFMEYAHPIANFFKGDCKKALKLIYAIRDSATSNGDRILAAKTILRLIPVYEKIKESLIMTGYKVEIDSHDCNVLWIYEHPAFKASPKKKPVCALHIDKGASKIWLGEGDGYRRHCYYDENLSIDLDESFSHSLSNLIKKGIKYEQDSA